MRLCIGLCAVMKMYTVQILSSFVRSVVASVRRDRTRRLKARVALLAAAALLFFFFFGTGHEAARPSGGADESYAAIVSPSPLEGLIPN